MNTFRIFLLCFFLTISWTGMAWAESPEYQALIDQLKQLRDGTDWPEDGWSSDLDKQIAVQEKMLLVTEKEFGRESVRYSAILWLMADLFDRQGNYQKAKQLFERSLEIEETLYGPEHPAIATSLSVLAEWHEDQDRYEMAEPLYQRALVIYEKTLDQYDPKIMYLRFTLTCGYLSQGRFVDIVMLWLRPRNQAPTHA